MKLRSPALFALGVLTTLTLGGSVAYAATGGSLVLGHSNDAGAVTRLSNPHGTALALSSKNGAPPLSVNRSAKIKHLNADLVDGVDFSTGRTGIIEGSTLDSDGLPFTAKCPSGTIATGGGGFGSGTDHIIYSGPIFNSTSGKFTPNSWEVLTDSNPVAFVVCYNPRGPVKKAARSLADTDPASVASIRAAAVRAAAGRSTP